MFKKLSAIALSGALVLSGAGSAFAYEVKSGDTMFKIARQNNLSLNELSRLNPQVKNLNLIYVGQTIKTIQDKEAKSYKKPVAKISKQSVTPVTSSKYSASEIDLLARLVRAEAQGESLSGKIAVANVVLNRVASSQFPNSIKGVIYQSGQFSPVTNGAINTPADSASIQAVREALNGKNLVGNSLFFYNPKTASSRWLDSRTTTAVIGNHTFKL